MKKINLKLALFVTLFALVAGCNSGDKKAELDKLIKERDALNDKIEKLREEMAKSDTGSKEKTRQVEVQPVALSTFRNYIEIQGKVDADENVALSAEMGGLVTRVLVKAGDQVKKGQLLAETDNKVILQGMAELQNALDLAATVYNRQKNLWDQKIGTEIQYLTAKNQKEALERRMATMQQQLEMTRITSPIDGTVDAVDIKAGQVAAPGIPLIRVVNLIHLKVVGEVPESFAGRIKKGDDVQVILPDRKDTIQTEVSFVAQVVAPLNRTFNVEARLSKGGSYQPNIVAVMKIADYTKENTVVIPVGTVQKTAEGEYVYVAQNGIARKTRVKTGRVYNGKAEITEGLKAGDKLITKGYQELNEGEALKF